MVTRKVPPENRPFTREIPEVAPGKEATTIGVEEEVGTDQVVGARLRGFKNLWTKDAWSFRTVSKGLSWKWKRDHPTYRPFFQKSDRDIQSFLVEMLKARAIEEARFLSFQGRLFSPQKGYGKEKSNPGYFEPEQKYPLSKVKDDLSCSSPSYLTPGFLGGVDRPERRLLACPHREILQEVPRLLHRMKEISVPGHALRPEHSPLAFTRLTKSILKELRLKGV